MTLEEAKKILKKEGFKLENVDYESFPSDAFTKYESPDVVEAMKIVRKASYSIGMKLDDFDSRKARLKKEFEANTTAPGGKNPALNESAKEFNDSLLDEQAKKIKNLEELSASRNEIIVKQAKKISAYQKQFKHLAEVLHKKNIKIDQLRKESSKHLRDKIKVFDENQELEKKANKYANMLADAHDELRQLKKKLAGIVVNNVNAQALKSAEHALVEKDAIIQEKDEVIEDLGKELKETKKMLVWVRNASKEYRDYGVEANNLVKELSRLYVVAYNAGSFDKAMLERCKNYQKYGFPATCNSETNKEIDEIASGKEHLIPAPEEPCGEPKKSINTGDYISKEELMKIQEEDVRKITTPPFSPISEMRKGNGIPDRMVVSADLGKGESYTSSVIVIPKDADPTLLRNIFKDMTDIINSEL